MRDDVALQHRLSLVERMHRIIPAIVLILEESQMTQLHVGPFHYLIAAFNIIKLGAVSIRKTVLPGMAIPMLKIRRPNGRLIFNMEITICR